MKVPHVSNLPVSTPPAASRTEGAGLGKQAFLQLLLTQLRNQDPLKPMEDREFIAQLAQFNTLEQMQEVQRTLAGVLVSQQLAQATGLIGKTVSGRLASGQDFTARVTEVRAGAAGPVLVTEAGTAALKDITKIT